MNLKRHTDNYTVNFLKFLLGLRSSSTSVSAAEHDLLRGLAHGKRCIIEVGVYEGATSQVFCREMDPAGRLYLVDPFLPEVRAERLLNVSFTRWVATKTVEPWRGRLQFVRQPSLTAAQQLQLHGRAELIFIDARHDYESVREDFLAWGPMLAPDASMAFHDSRQCPARPDLGSDTGPVRLIHEIRSGAHGAWKEVASADSITVIKRASAGVSLT